MYAVELPDGTVRYVPFKDAMANKFESYVWQNNIIRFRLNPEWPNEDQFICWQEAHKKPRLGWSTDQIPRIRSTKKLLLSKPTVVALDPDIEKDGVVFSKL